MKKRQKILEKMVWIVCILSVLMMAAVVVKAAGMKDTFVPPEFEKEAKQGTPKVPESLGYMPLDVSEGFRVSVCGNLKTDGDTAEIWLTSAKENQVWLKLQLYEGTRLLGETGVLKPGEYVQKVHLSNVSAKTTEVKMKLIAYTPDTWYSAGNVELKTMLSVGGK